MTKVISEILFPQILERFRPYGAHIESGGWTVIIPAKSPDFGDLIIQDDVSVITFFVGRFTHFHIYCDEEEEIIASRVVDFIQQVLADEIVAWGSHQGCGGWHKRKPRRGFFSRLRSEYVWSGKLD